MKHLKTGWSRAWVKMKYAILHRVFAFYVLTHHCNQWCVRTNNWCVINYLPAPLSLIHSELPAAATGLPRLAGRVGGDAAPSQSRSLLQGQRPGSNETSAGSALRQLEAQPWQISVRCSSCEQRRIKFTTDTFRYINSCFLQEKTEPGTGGERDEVMRGATLCAGRLKAKRIELL